jgi:hypothetical protein
LAWVHEHIFAGGGDHIAATWKQFSTQLDIQAVVHLSYPEPLVFRGHLPEGFLWLDIEEEQQADHAARELCGRFVHESISSGYNVLLHSKHGRHRTRWIYVAYLIYAGKQVRAALTQAEEKPWQAPYHTDRGNWSDFKDYLKDLRLPD